MGRSALGRIWGRGTELPCPLGVPPFQYFHVFINPDALRALSFRWSCHFMVVSLCRHDWLNHQSLVINSTSSALSLPGGQKVGLNIPTFLDTPWSLWSPTSTEVSSLRKTFFGRHWRFIVKNSHLPKEAFTTAEIPRVLGTVCQGPKTETKYIFLL